jgi:beta-glucosidase
MSEAAGMDCIYRDPNAPVEARVKDLLSRMTLEEKVGQMTQIERIIAQPKPDLIKDFCIGTLSLSLPLSLSRTRKLFN